MIYLKEQKKVKSLTYKLRKITNDPNTCKTSSLLGKAAQTLSACPGGQLGPLQPALANS